MEQPVRLADGTSNGYGLGIYNRTIGGRRVIDHGGEAVGFRSQNTVWPDDRVAVVVLTNADFSGATTTLTDGIAKIVLPHGAQAETGEADRSGDARSAVAAVLAGRIDPGLFTENAQYYFTAQVLADYRASLVPLGALLNMEPTRPPRLRGGFVNRVYKLKFAKRSLMLSTYAEPGEHGRWEQLIIGE
jgi:hypothetical protein